MIISIIFVLQAVKFGPATQLKVPSRTGSSTRDRTASSADPVGEEIGRVSSSAAESALQVTNTDTRTPRAADDYTAWRLKPCKSERLYSSYHLRTQQTADPEQEDDGSAIYSDPKDYFQCKRTPSNNYARNFSEPDYMNRRSLNSRHDYDTSIYSSLDDYLSPSERTNYAKYINSQYHKYTDAYPKCLAYPLRTFDYYPSEEEALYLDPHRPNYSRQRYYPSMYSRRPHGFIDFAPTLEDNFLPLNRKGLDSDYHDYVNFCPPTMYESDYSTPGYTPSMGIGPELPKYEEPPDYSLHRHRKSGLNVTKYPLQHESSLPPVVMKELTTYQEPYNSRSDGLGTSIMNNNALLYGQRDAKKEPDGKLHVPRVRLSPPSETLPIRGKSIRGYDESSSVTSSPRMSREFAEEIPIESVRTVPRGNPPPYHSYHEILDYSSVINQFCPSQPVVPANVANSRACDSWELQVPVNIDRSDVNLNVPSAQADKCPMNHQINTVCKMCNTSNIIGSNSTTRSNYRKSAASLVRRASSGASLLKRKSAKLRSSFHTEVDLEETPSILARLRKEWQDRRGGSKSTGNIPTSADGKLSDPSSTSSLSSSVQSKSSENLRSELTSFSHNLSEEKWTITENQTMECKSVTSSREQHVHCNNNPSSPISGKRNSKQFISEEGQYLSLANKSSSNCIPEESPYLSPSENNAESFLNYSNKSEAFSKEKRYFSMLENCDVPQQEGASNLMSIFNNSKPSQVVVSTNDAQQRYYEVDISDNDSTYDTLIIKDVGDLNDSRTLGVNCNCVDGSCSHLDDLSCDSRASSTNIASSNEAIAIAS